MRSLPRITQCDVNRVCISVNEQTSSALIQVEFLPMRIVDRVFLQMTYTNWQVVDFVLLMLPGIYWICLKFRFGRRTLYLTLSYKLNVQTAHFGFHDLVRNKVFVQLMQIFNYLLVIIIKFPDLLRLITTFSDFVWFNTFFSDLSWFTTFPIYYKVVAFFLDLLWFSTFRCICSLLW